MMALSIRQPWAWLIVNGHKDVENRTWPTDRTGPILIHAGLKMSREDYHQARRLCEAMGIELPRAEYLMPRGGVIGRATITGCVTASPSPWFFGPYGFTLTDAAPLPFRPARGHLNFFDLSHRAGDAGGAGLFDLEHKGWAG